MAACSLEPFRIFSLCIFVSNPSYNLEAFTGFKVDGQYLFPILFVTIACGAVSGFHSLVSAGVISHI